MDSDCVGPIRRSLRLINIRVRIQKLEQLGDHKDHFKTIGKITGNTIKNGFVNYNTNTNKISYHSHRSKCFGCSLNPKLINGRRNKLKADTKNTIESCLKSLNL